MAETPKPSELQNVFAMDKPEHMLRKLFWEFNMFMKAMSVHHDDKQWPDAAIFIAFSTAITAWHISDWIWQSDPKTRVKMASRLKVQFDENTQTGRRVGLGRFQDNVAQQCRALHLCREIANGSKHMRMDKPDTDVKAVAEWHKAIQGAGFRGARRLGHELKRHGRRQERGRRPSVYFRTRLLGKPVYIRKAC